jgi:hypothetical protein
VTCKPDRDVEVLAGDTPWGAALALLVATIACTAVACAAGFVVGAFVRGFLWGAGL